MLRLEHHRQTDFEVLERAAFRAEMHARGSQRHLDVTRARERRPAVHHVIGQHRQTGGVELVFPRERMFTQTITEQRMLATAIDQVIRFSRRPEPVTLVLPRIRRQRDVRAFSGAKRSASTPAPLAIIA